MKREYRVKFGWEKYLYCLAVAVALVAGQSACAGNFSEGQAKSNEAAEMIGSGDGQIHIIPSLSSPSVKNNSTLTIQAVVKGVEGVTDVTAIIRCESGSLGNDEIAHLTLKPADADTGGINAKKTAGIWQAKWEAEGLKEAYYRVEIKVTDKTGHEYFDRSMQQI